MKTSANQSGRPSVILISGYRGLAETFLKTFVSQGHSVSVLVRNPDAIPSLQSHYPQVHFFHGDCVSQEDCRDWVHLANERFGTIDVLVNNAAVTGPTGKWHQISFEEVTASLDVNLLAPLFLTQLVLPVFLEKGRGMVLNLSGGGATTARPHFTSYALAKCALVRATESLAKEYPAFRFYAISPGALKTPLLEGILKLDPARVGQEYEDIKQRIAQGGEDPGKAAALASWLIEKAPTLLSGKVISAIWDNYGAAPEFPEELGWWTLRRVDETLAKKMKELAP